MSGTQSQKEAGIAETRTECCSRHPPHHDTADWSGGGGVDLSALKASGTADCEQVDKGKLLQLITQPSDKSIAGLCVSNQGWPKTTGLGKRIQTGGTHNNCQTLLAGKEAVNTMAECFWLWTAVYQWESQKHRFRQPVTKATLRILSAYSMT